jgi:hypothetical protein
VSFAAIILYVASQRVIPKVSVYFVIDSVRKLLDTPSYSTSLISDKAKLHVGHEYQAAGVLCRHLSTSPLLSQQEGGGEGGKVDITPKLCSHLTT